MTREEVIGELKYAKAMCEFDPMTGEVGCRNEEDRRQSEAFGIAIETLENENALIDRVLEIIDDRISLINKTVPGHNLEQELEIIRPKIEALKGGNKG